MVWSLFLGIQTRFEFRKFAGEHFRSLPFRIRSLRFRIGSLFFRIGSLFLRIGSLFLRIGSLCFCIGSMRFHDDFCVQVIDHQTGFA